MTDDRYRYTDRFGHHRANVNLSRCSGCLVYDLLCATIAHTLQMEPIKIEDVNTPGVLIIPGDNRSELPNSCAVPSNEKVSPVQGLVKPSPETGILSLTPGPSCCIHAAPAVSATIAAIKAAILRTTSMRFISTTFFFWCNPFSLRVGSFCLQEPG
jgi:hypothetical protein